MTDHLSVGVIGHVDHGKTTLVKALTGTETDRLAEERERGLTIVLGFAYRETDRGLIDFIDAPGHADFVRTMISGATGIDAALIVVAANEGIMPQTREHLRIVSLLGIKQAVVALTKTDLVEPGDIRATSAALEDCLSDLGFDAVTIVPVCAPTGDGIDKLVDALDALFSYREERPDTGRFYLPFDRVFTMKGHGAVVTGTLRAGTLGVGDEGEIAGAGIRARVRRLEVHGAEVDRAEPGQRVAANLRVEGGAKLERGQALAPPAWLVPSEWWTASLQMAPDTDATLRNGKPVRLLHGTREVIATLRLLDRDAIGPGESANIQFHLNQPEASWDHEHFIVRTISPVETVGGGRFLDTTATRIKRHDAQAIGRLEAGTSGDARQAALAAIEQAGADGITIAELAQRLSVPADAVRELIAGTEALTSDDLVLGPEQVEVLSGQLIDLLKGFHAANPSRTGMPRLELIEKLGSGAVPVGMVLKNLQGSGELIDHSGQIGLASFDPLGSLSGTERARLEALEAHIRKTPLMPPTMDEVIALDRNHRPGAELLIETGRVVPLHDFKRKNLFLFHADDIADAVQSLREAWPTPAQFRLGEAREHLGVTRKFLQPLLEYLDKQKITRRRDDFREFL